MGKKIRFGHSNRIILEFTLNNKQPKSGFSQKEISALITVPPCLVVHLNKEKGHYFSLSLNWK